MKQVSNTAIKRHSAVDTDEEALAIERSYWENYVDYDWSSDSAKDQAIACIPQIDGDILELCVGGGAFARKIPHSYRSYTGWICQSLYWQLSRTYPHVKTVHGDAQDLPFEDNWSMLFWSSRSPHLPRFQQTVDNGFGVCPAGGVLLLIRAQRQSVVQGTRLCDFFEARNSSGISLESTLKMRCT